MSNRIRYVVLLAAFFATVASLPAAELRLRAQCAPQGSLVTLGDIADVFGTDSGQTDALKRIDLFPAPASDQPRVLRVRELQDLLAQRGMNLAEHRFSGSAQVQIAAARKRGEADQPVSEQSAKRVQRRIQEAILKYLQTQSSATQGATLQFEMSSAQQRLVANSAAPITVSGGNAPWTGAQTLTIGIEGAEGSRSFSLDVRVNARSMVVAAVHSLARGTIVQAADLALVHGDPRDDNGSGSFHSMDEAVGKQTTKAIVEGKILTLDDVRAPLMVRRSEVVTVYARSSGIRIHTTARAKDDGALGDLVAVESLADRKTFTARVCGPRETEVFAQAASAE